MLDDKRQLDLLRYCRGELHQNGLITDEEYSWLVFECQPGAVNRLEGYDALRASLHDLEKRHAEAVAALGAARRERDEAKAWKVEYCRQVAEKDEQVAEVHSMLFKVEADRDTALFQAAGLRSEIDSYRQKEELGSK